MADVSLLDFRFVYIALLEATEVTAVTRASTGVPV